MSVCEYPCNYFFFFLQGPFRKKRTCRYLLLSIVKKNRRYHFRENVCQLRIKTRTLNCEKHWRIIRIFSQNEISRRLNVRIKGARKKKKKRNPIKRKQVIQILNNDSFFFFFSIFFLNSREQTTTKPVRFTLISSIIHQFFNCLNKSPPLVLKYNRRNINSVKHHFFPFFFFCSFFVCFLYLKTSKERKIKKIEKST